MPRESRPGLSFSMSEKVALALIGLLLLVLKHFLKV